MLSPAAIVQQLAPPKHPDFNTDVLIPLRAEQAREAAEAAAAIQRELDATANRMQPEGSYGNNYAWGNCTAYVASRIPVPNSMGNANAWAAGLLSAGWRTGAARRGAVAQTTAGWAGHVAIVEEARGDMVLISEMNYAGLGVVDQRWIAAGEMNYFY